MSKYLKRFETHTQYNNYASNGSMPKSSVSFCADDHEVHYNPWTWSDQYMQTVALEDGTISFNILKSMGTEYITSISYSTDDGETWTTTSNRNGKSANLQITVNVEEGDKVLWKGIAQQLGYPEEPEYNIYNGSFFSSTCEFDAMGNVMSLIHGDNFKNQTTIESDGCFAYLFYDGDRNIECKIVNAENLSLPATTLAKKCYHYMFGECSNLLTTPELPATTLAEGCYDGMFFKCTSITYAPDLPATTLAEGCYYGMFQSCTNLTSVPMLHATTLAVNCYDTMFGNCSSLESAPLLPAKTLAKNCYYNMFYKCTSLVVAPELPATTLEEGCYYMMFHNCTSLTTAPVLPATTLAKDCYGFMFRNCTSLTTAPTLPATTLVEGCYKYMFRDCSSLNYIKAMFTTYPSTTYTETWVQDVASSGTFVKNSAAAWSTSSVDAIPLHWTVQTASA